MLEHLLARATAQETSGHWPDAAAAYAQAFRLAVQARDPEGLLEVVIKLADCYRQAGDHAQSAEQFELALVLAERSGQLRGLGRSLNGLALLSQAEGRLAEAEARYREALDYAERAGDDSLAGSVLQNLGIIANIRGDHPAARTWYLCGLERLEQTPNRRSTAAALNNLGMLHVDLGELDAAAGYFSRAAQVSAEIGDVPLQGIVAINRVELYLARDEPGRARDSCDEGFEIFSRLGHLNGQAEAFKFYGIIYRRTGKLHLAEIHLNQAIESTQGREPLLEAEAHRELALVMRALNRNREALAALNRSHALFTGLQARPDQDDINQRIRKLESDFLSLVRFWGESIEAKDRYTSGHCERVADYACRLAERLGIGEREMVWFRMGAFLHDLGKTEVPEEILNKPGRLSEEERAVMERHPLIGDEMLAPVEFPWDIRPMVRSHHERWDGAGYPDRISGRSIPLAARILRVADVFDALTTARSYRRPLTPHEAMEIMAEDAGSFDPEIFAHFQQLFPEIAAGAAEADSGPSRAAGRP